jgi:anti-sigma factor RsiW
MKNKPASSNESLWRQPLSATERAKLPDAPEQRLEARLTGALSQLSDAPVPSNFTARVLAAVELNEAQSARSRGWALNWRLLWPRVAVMAAVMIFAGISLQRHEVHSHRAALAKSVAQVTAQPIPNVDALENLDAIQRMGRIAHADGELLAALQ